jgi:hypothetical protein
MNYQLVGRSGYSIRFIQTAYQSDQYNIRNAI